MADTNQFKRLFLFLLTRAAPASLPTAFYVALRPLFFSTGPVCSSFSLKPTPFYTLFADLGSTNKSATSLLSDSGSVLSSVFYLKLCGRSRRNCLLSPPVLSGYNESPDICFSRGMTRLMSWPDGECYSCPLQFLIVSLSLISRIHSSLFSDWRRTVSSKFFDTQATSISTEELVLPRHARCVLSRLRCNGHSLLLGSYLSRIDRIKNPSCSACGHPSQDISDLILHCPSMDSLRRSLFGDSLSLYNLWSRPWGVSRLLGLHGLPPCPHPSEGVG